jgi:hypothetical protein
MHVACRVWHRVQQLHRKLHGCEHCAAGTPGRHIRHAHISHLSSVNTTAHQSHNSLIDGLTRAALSAVWQAQSADQSQPRPANGSSKAADSTKEALRESHCERTLPRGPVPCLSLKEIGWVHSLAHALVKTTTTCHAARARTRATAGQREAAEAAHDSDVHKELDEAFGCEGHPLQVGTARDTHACDCCGWLTFCAGPVQCAPLCSNGVTGSTSVNGQHRTAVLSQKGESVREDSVRADALWLLCARRTAAALIGCAPCFDEKQVERLQAERTLHRTGRAQYR